MNRLNKKIKKLIETWTEKTMIGIDMLINNGSTLALFQTNDIKSTIAILSTLIDKHSYKVLHVDLRTLKNELGVSDLLFTINKTNYSLDDMLMFRKARVNIYVIKQDFPIIMHIKNNVYLLISPVIVKEE